MLYNFTLPKSLEKVISLKSILRRKIITTYLKASETNFFLVKTLENCTSKDWIRSHILTVNRSVGRKIPTNYHKSKCPSLASLWFSWLWINKIKRKGQTSETITLRLFSYLFLKAFGYKKINIPNIENSERNTRLTAKADEISRPHKYSRDPQSLKVTTGYCCAFLSLEIILGLTNLLNFT